VFPETWKTARLVLIRKGDESLGFFRTWALTIRLRFRTAVDIVTPVTGKIDKHSPLGIFRLMLSNFSSEMADMAAPESSKALNCLLKLVIGSPGRFPFDRSPSTTTGVGGVRVFDTEAS